MSFMRQPCHADVQFISICTWATHGAAHSPCPYLRKAHACLALQFIGPIKFNLVEYMSSRNLWLANRGGLFYESPVYFAGLPELMAYW